MERGAGRLAPRLVKPTSSPRIREDYLVSMAGRLAQKGALRRQVATQRAGVFPFAAAAQGWR